MKKYKIVNFYSKIYYFLIELIKITHYIFHFSVFLIIMIPYGLIALFATEKQYILLLLDWINIARPKEGLLESYRNHALPIFTVVLSIPTIFATISWNLARTPRIRLVSQTTKNQTKNFFQIAHVFLYYLRFLPLLV